MKRIALIAAVGGVLALSAHSAAGTTAQPTPQPSKAETFLLVEVKGTIGKDFSAAKLKAAIAEARTAKVATVVLSMDTSGGSVPDAEAIVDLIIENKDLRFVALVNKALSAGAAITLACKEIYVTEAATIGAAVGKKTLVIPKMVHLGSLTIIVGQPSRTMMPPSRVLRTL